MKTLKKGKYQSKNCRTQTLDKYFFFIDNIISFRSLLKILLIHYILLFYFVAFFKFQNLHIFDNFFSAGFFWYENVFKLYKEASRYLQTQRIERLFIFRKMFKTTLNATDKNFQYCITVLRECMFSFLA